MKDVSTLCSLCVNTDTGAIKQLFSSGEVDLKLVGRDSNSFSVVSDYSVIHFSFNDEVREILVEGMDMDLGSDVAGVFGIKELLEIFLHEGFSIKNLMLSCVKPSKSVYILAEFKTHEVEKAVTKVLISKDLQLNYLYPYKLRKCGLLLKLINFSKELWECVYGDRRSN